MRQIVPLLLMLLLGAPLAAFGQTNEARSLVWQGVERHYTIYRSAQTGRPAPVVVALSGLTQSLENLRRWLQLDQAADQHGFVVAYPRPIARKWSYWRGGGVLLPDGSAEIDDVGFISAVVDALVKEGAADPAHIYATGVSRGALMSWTLACERADLFAAVAPVSSAMTEAQLASCHPTRPLPVIAVDGTNDPVQFYDGWLSPTIHLLSVPETMAFWWRLNGCTGEKATRLPHRNRDDPTRILLLEWTGCATGNPVMLYRVSGGGHIAPSFTDHAADAPDMGRQSRDIETADVLWDAFARIGPGKPP